MFPSSSIRETLHATWIKITRFGSEAIGPGQRARRSNRPFPKLADPTHPYVRWLNALHSKSSCILPTSPSHHRNYDAIFDMGFDLGLAKSGKPHDRRSAILA